jgi:hypothetical protein
LEDLLLPGDHPKLYEVTNDCRGMRGDGDQSDQSDDNVQVVGVIVKEYGEGMKLEIMAK